MPELPEVETYARDLAVVLVGRTFAGARTRWPRQLPLNSPDELDRRIRGQTVRSVGRRGKYIVVRLDRDHLLVHLKMSGRLQVAPADDAPSPYAHTVFDLDGGDELRFHDPRKFGRVYLLDDPGPVLAPLGPEPLAAATTLARFRDLLAGRRARLKPLLLDQRVIAGIGNIYADESLWRARLHPLRTADSLSDAEVVRLHRAIRHVLRTAVRARGTTLGTGGYRDLTGNPGEMQATLAVFRRAGLPCPRCRQTIERSVVAGRGTHVCRKCQRPPDVDRTR